MEREILYRGLHRRKGEKVWMDGTPVESKWIYGGVCQGEGDFSIIYQTEPEIQKYPVYTDTLGQYTGLTDKNGVKIFEGDILRSNNNPKDIRQVIFGEFMVIDFETESETDEVTGWHCDVIPTDALSRTRPFCLTLPLTDYYIHQCNMEVVGNIYDNPEMLKGEPNV